MSNVHSPQTRSMYDPTRSSVIDRGINHRLRDVLDNVDDHRQMYTRFIPPTPDVQTSPIPPTGAQKDQEQLPLSPDATSRTLHDSQFISPTANTVFSSVRINSPPVNEFLPPAANSPKLSGIRSPLHHDPSLAMNSVADNPLSSDTVLSALGESDKGTASDPNNSKNLFFSPNHSVSSSPSPARIPFARTPQTSSPRGSSSVSPYSPYAFRKSTNNSPIDTSIHTPGTLNTQSPFVPTTSSRNQDLYTLKEGHQDSSADAASLSATMEKVMQKGLRTYERKLSDLSGKHETLQKKYLMAVEERKHVEYELLRLEEQFNDVQATNQKLLAKLDAQTNSHTTFDTPVDAPEPGSPSMTVATAVEAERKRSAEALRRMKVSSDKRFRDWNAKIETWKNEVQKAMDEKLASSRAYVLASREKLLKERKEKDKALEEVKRLEDDIVQLKVLHQQEKDEIEKRLSKEAKEQVATSKAQTVQELRGALEKEVREEFIANAKEGILQKLEGTLRMQLESDIRATLEREYAQKMTDLYSEFDSKLQEALTDPNRQELCSQCQSSRPAVISNNAEEPTTTHTCESISSPHDSPHVNDDTSPRFTPDQGLNRSRGTPGSSQRAKTTPFAYPFPPDFSLVSPDSAQKASQPQQGSPHDITIPPQTSTHKGHTEANTPSRAMTSPQQIPSPLSASSRAEYSSPQSSTSKTASFRVHETESPQTPDNSNNGINSGTGSTDRTAANSTDRLHTSTMRSTVRPMPTENYTYDDDTVSLDSDSSEELIPLQSSMEFDPQASPVAANRHGATSPSHIPVLTSTDSIPYDQESPSRSPRGGETLEQEPTSPALNISSQSDQDSKNATIRVEVREVDQPDSEEEEDFIDDVAHSPGSFELDSDTGISTDDDNDDELSLDDIHVSPYKFACGREWINRLTKDMTESDVAMNAGAGSTNNEPPTKETIHPTTETSTPTTTDPDTPDTRRARSDRLNTQRGRSRVVVERNKASDATGSYGHQPRGSTSPDTADTTVPKDTDVAPPRIPRTPTRNVMTPSPFDAYDHMPMTPTSLEGLDTKYIIAIENMSGTKIRSLLERAGVPFSDDASPSTLRYLLMLATKRGLENQQTSVLRTPTSATQTSDKKDPQTKDTPMDKLSSSPDSVPDALQEEYKELPLSFDKDSVPDNTSPHADYVNRSTTDTTNATVPESLPRRAPPVPPSTSHTPTPSSMSPVHTPVKSRNDAKAYPAEKFDSVSPDDLTDLDSSSDLSVIDADADYDLERSINFASKLAQHTSSNSDMEHRPSRDSTLPANMVNKDEGNGPTAGPTAGPTDITEEKDGKGRSERVKKNKKEIEERQRQRLEELRRAEMRAEEEQNQRDSIEKSLNTRVEQWVASAAALRPLLVTLNSTLGMLLSLYGKDNDRSAIHLKDSLLEEIDNISSKRDLRKVYFKVIRILHPDKVSSLGISIGAMLVCQKVFSVLSDAYAQAQTRPDGGMGVIVKRASDSFTSSAFTSSNFFAQAHASFGSSRSKSQQQRTTAPFSRENEDTSGFFRSSASKRHSKSWYSSSTGRPMSMPSEAFFAARAKYTRESYRPKTSTSSSTSSSKFSMPHTGGTSGLNSMHSRQAQERKASVPSQSQQGTKYAPSSMASILAAAARARNAAMFANNSNIGSNPPPANQSSRN